LQKFLLQDIAMQPLFWKASPFGKQPEHSAARFRTVSLHVGARLRQLREEKGLSQVEIEKRSGLMKCYISRVEHGYKIPSLATLERFAAALDVPFYRLFYDGSGAPPTPSLTPRPALQELVPPDAQTASAARFARKLGSLWNRIGEFEHQVLLDMAKRLASRTGGERNSRTPGPRATPRA
jgi:transcriptional regulator with XRE-family HTH domain